MSTLPPGPTGFLAMLRYLRDPYGSTMRTFAKWGDPVSVYGPDGAIVLTANPEHVKAMLSIDPELLAPYAVEVMAPVIGHESLMMLGGERHRAARKLLQPPFHGARMRAYARVMHDIAVEDIAGWPAGEPFAIQSRTQAISLRVILRAVLGIGGNEGIAVEKMVLRLIDALTPSLLFFPGLRRELGGLTPWARLKGAMDALEAHLDGVIEARRHDGLAREDILSLIMAARYDDGSAMTNRQIFETMMTVIVAGHETSALSLAWALWFVHRHPEVKARLRAELGGVDHDDPEAMTRLPYLDAVCNETLRIRPIAPSIVRRLRQPLAFAGFDLPAGATIGASIIGLHQNAELYPEPLGFRPERFIGRSYAAWEFLPFGGGHRRCIGAAFALFEMKIVLAAVLQRSQLALADDKPIAAAPRSTVIGPKRAIRFVATPP